MKQERQEGGREGKKRETGDAHRLMMGHIEHGMVFPTQVQPENAYRDEAHRGCLSLNVTIVHNKSVKLRHPQLSVRESWLVLITGGAGADVKWNIISHFTFLSAYADPLCVDSFNHRKKYDYSRQDSFKTPSYFCKNIQDMFLQKKKNLSLNELNCQTSQTDIKSCVPPPKK